MKRFELYLHILKKNYEPCYVKLATVDGIENKITVTKYITNQNFSADTFAFKNADKTINGCIKRVCPENDF